MQLKQLPMTFTQSATLKTVPGKRPHPGSWCRTRWCRWCWWSRGRSWGEAWWSSSSYSRQWWWPSASPRWWPRGATWSGTQQGEVRNKRSQESRWLWRPMSKGSALAAAARGSIPCLALCCPSIKAWNAPKIYLKKESLVESFWKSSGTVSPNCECTIVTVLKSEDAGYR